MYANTGINCLPGVCIMNDLQSKFTAVIMIYATVYNMNMIAIVISDSRDYK